MISIITSMYKAEKHIEKYAARLLDFQKGAKFPFEIIIISNETSDSEKKTLDKIKKYLGDSVKIISVPRESIYASWNRGVENSKYELVTPWNVDDIRFPEAIEDAITRYASVKDRVFYFPFKYKRYVSLLGFDFLVKVKTFYPPEFSKEIFSKEMHAGPFFIIPKTLLKNNLFDDSFKIAGDFEWCVRSVKNNILFEKIDIVAGIFTNNGKTLSGSRSVLHKEENESILNIKIL